jgi:SAM-dependent methyltransferase
MKPYTDLALSYDFLLKHVDYQSWYIYISTIMIRYIDNPRIILELGCGTGKFGAKFSADDFQIFGLDKSIEMLKVARLRAFKNFSIVCGDMTDFYFSRKFDYIFSVHDTLNYLLEYSDIRKLFRSVKRVMHSESVFMFDITTEYNINCHFDGKTCHYRTEKGEIEWSNLYDRECSLVFSTLKFKTGDGKESVEEHVQKIYTVDEIKKLLGEEGFEVLDIFGDYTFKPPHEKTVMINFITRVKKS